MLIRLGSPWLTILLLCVAGIGLYEGVPHLRAYQRMSKQPEELSVEAAAELMRQEPSQTKWAHLTGRIASTGESVSTNDDGTNRTMFLALNLSKDTAVILTYRGLHVDEESARQQEITGLLTQASRDSWKFYGGHLPDSVSTVLQLEVGQTPSHELYGAIFFLIVILIGIGGAVLNHAVMRKPRR